MKLVALTEFLRRLTPSDIQWVVECWHIKAMTSYDFKEKCVILIGPRHCSYYPIHRIARQFGDRQGVPYDNDSFNTLVLTLRF